MLPPSHGRAPQPRSRSLAPTVCPGGYAFALGGAPKETAPPRHWGDKQGSGGFAPG